MTTPFDDTTFNAWLDSELPAERRAEVEAWLHEHPEEAARVRLWASDGAALRARFDGVLGEAVPQRLADVVLHATPRDAAQGWQRIAAAVALALLGGAVGAALTWRLQQQPVPLAGGGGGASGEAPMAWVQRAAVAHAVYVPEGRHAVEVKAQEEHLSRWLTRRLETPVKLFDLREQGFELVGGRLLPDASGPSAQLMYQAIAAPATGHSAAASAPPAKPVRVTVYLRKPSDDTAAAFSYEQRDGLGMFYWVEGRSAAGGPTGYALVGALPRDKLLALAEAIYRQGHEPPR
ncbi:MAG: anti-sigma factor, partial [Rhizobacter sp.]|nr:anti-sigma factor [Rhizobacter sp.]